MTPLYLFQTVCLSVFALMAFILVLSRFYLQQRFHRYEQGRWLLVLAMLLLVAQYALQMLFGFRASDEDIGASVNALFYAPVVMLMGLVHLVLVGGIRFTRRFILYSNLIYLLMQAVFWGGYIYYGSLHLHALHYVIEVLFIVGIVLSLCMSGSEVLRVRRRLRAETGNVNHSYHRHMYFSTATIFLCCLMAPVAIRGGVLLVVCGITCILSIVVYVIGFICTGFYMTPIIDVVEEASDAPVHPSSDSASFILSEERVAEIESALDAWVESNGYRDPEATLTLVARQTGIPRRELSLYMDKQKQCTFRIWLSSIRLEVAKQLLVEHPEYSNEVVAYESGFTSRSQLYNVFRDYTGKTPKEWKEGVS